MNGANGTLYWGGTGTDALAESTPSGTLTAEYVFFGGKRTARIDRPSGTVHYYFSDQVNSARLVARVIDSNNVVVEQESDFYPYGGEMVIRGNDPNHYKFSGKERDTETGLDNFGARYYASGMSRFMTPDWDVRPVTVPYATFGDPQTLNLYTYVENSPLNRIDADGHEDKPQAAPLDPFVDDMFSGANAWEEQQRAEQERDQEEEQRAKDPNTPPAPPTPDPANTRTDPSMNPPPNRGGLEPPAPLESRAHGKGERGQTAKPGGTENETKGAKPVRDDKGNITGWRLPSADGKGVKKTLDWGKDHGLQADDKKWQQGSKAVGVAIAVYWIVSEGSRLFLPRNLLPIP